MNSEVDATETTAPTEAPSGTVARVMSVISALTDEQGPVSVQRIAELCGLSPSTAHRFLRLLSEQGMVERDPWAHTYTVGPELYRIAVRTVEKMSIVDLVKPVLDELAGRFDETVLFGRYSEREHSVRFIARADGRQSLQYRIEMNEPVSVAVGASGKSIAAMLPEHVIRQLVVEGLPSRVTGGVQPAEELLAELETIRALGYAVSEAEKLPDARGIGVPVFGRRGVEGSLTLTSPRQRLPHAEIESIAHALVEAAAALSRTLGAPSEQTDGPRG